MGVLVEQAAKWKPVATETGTEVRVSYRCPTCHREQAVALQPPPWQVPVLADDEALFVTHNDPEGQAAANRFEARRAAGEVEHEQQDVISTQLWCHGCGKGTEVTVRREG